MFRELLGNLAVDNARQISLRYGEITASLNKEFRETDSKTANSLQVGSYGRGTAIKGISDLDMLYIMPAEKWENYKDGKQSKLLSDTKDAIKSRYPTTEIFVDRLVVRVLYTNFHVEVQPVFEQSDGSFKFPDTYNGGRWRITKPREELNAMQEFNAQKNNNLRRLCKMTRAWKNKHGVVMGGLLVDTLAYNFLVSTEEYDDKSFLYYDFMSRDFFAYLKDQPNQEYYAALGSRQHLRGAMQVANSFWCGCVPSRRICFCMKLIWKGIFSYLPDYTGSPISQTMPVRKEPFEFDHFLLPHFFLMACNQRPF